MDNQKNGKPSPGSDEAVDKGCTCPSKKSGKGLAGMFKKRDGRWIDTNCPVHGDHCTYCGEINCKGDRLAYNCGE